MPPSDQRAYLCGMDPDCYLTYKWNNELKYAFIYHFFGLLWTNQVPWPCPGVSCCPAHGRLTCAAR